MPFQTADDWVKALAPFEVLSQTPEKVFNAHEPAALAERLTLFFESRQNLSKHLKVYGGFSPNARQASHIAACLRQAREFLRISRGSDLFTKPISLYYGMASYAKALAISLGNPAALDQFPQSHGLKTISGFGQPMEALQVRTDGDDGLFQRFARSLSQLAGSPAETKGGHSLWIRIGSTLPSDFHFVCDLQGLLARIIGIEDTYRDTFAVLPLNAPAELKLTHFGPDSAQPQASLAFRLPPGTDAAWVANLHPVLGRWLVRDQDGQFRDHENRRAVFENLPPSTSPRPATADEQAPLLQPLAGLLLPLTRGQQGDSRLVAALNGMSIPEPAIQLAALFLLSSVARYRPDIWSSFSSFDSTDDNSRLHAVLDALFYRAETVFPLQVLAALGRMEIVVWDGRPRMWA